jgi:hypothetical protein
LILPVRSDYPSGTNPASSTAAHGARNASIRTSAQAFTAHHLKNIAYYLLVSPSGIAYQTFLHKVIRVFVIRICLCDK